MHIKINRKIKRKADVVLLVTILCLALSSLKHYDQAMKMKSSKAYKNTESSTINSVNRMIDRMLVSNHTLACRNNSFLPDFWCMDQDQTPRYVGKEDWPPSSILHYTHQGYENCLANKTVVFIGDSRVRYQFMHLAHFLLSKRPMKCQDYNTSANYDSGCYLIDHEHHGHMDTKNWTSWYQESTSMLTSASQEEQEHQMYQQHSICDCFRSHPFRPRQIYENRFIKRDTPFGEVNLAYFQNFLGNIRLDEEYPPFSPFSSSSPKRCKTGLCGKANRTDAFQGDTNATLWNILPKMNTTHAFVNMGWEHMFGFQAQSNFSCELKAFEKSYPDIKVFLISHPPALSGGTYFNATQLECDSNVLDRTNIVTKDVPQHWYWDNQHVLSILNEEYNHQLVEKICPFEFKL